MKHVLLSLSFVAMLNLAVASACHANELRSSDSHDVVSLPSVSYLVLKANSPKYRFLQSEGDNYYAVPTPPSLSVRVKRLRGTGTAFFAITAFPFLPVGIALSTSEVVKKTSLWGDPKTEPA